MFTGIITHVGKFKGAQNHRLTFSADKLIFKKLTQGASIAVNGACLTVCDEPKNNTFSVTLMPETVKRTTLGALQKNDIVNLELPVTPGNFLAGHIVQGHIDGTGIIKDIAFQNNNRLIKISISSALHKYIVGQGSIAVNGVSLTVIQAEKNYFTIGIIPYTWKNTALSGLKINDKVNIETDILAKYIGKLIQK